MSCTIVPETGCVGLEVGPVAPSLGIRLTPESGRLHLVGARSGVYRVTLLHLPSVWVDVPLPELVTETRMPRGPPVLVGR